MPVIKNRFEVDGAQALRTVELVQKRFLGYNSSLGQVVSQQAAFTKSSKAGLQTLVQISDEGRKTTTVLKSVGDQYQVLSTKIGQASVAQRKAAQELREQAKLADDLARQIVGRGARRKGEPITTGITVGSDSKSDTAAVLANITKAQAQAAARDNRLTKSQTADLLNLVEQAGKVKAAFTAVNNVFDSFMGKLHEAGKIVFATAIYRSISLITTALKEGTTAAVEYSNQIGLIQTISQDSGETFDSWNAAIKRTADSLGVSSSRVAKDAYDALSNQVIKTSEDFGILETAIRLEQITGSQAGTGLNVLSSLINGLGVNSGQAGVLADKLFTIVDVGKVKLEGLDKVIGRTTSLQKQAGASFNETAGALALLTQAGIDEQESTTLLNNIFSETIKPNKALSDQLEKMGFNTGEAAIQTLGLVDYLKALKEASAGTKDGLATFFPDIRGLRGASVATQNLEGLQKAIDAVRNSQGNASKASDIVNANPGQILLQEQERIKNFFTNDIGVEAVKAIAKLTQSLGGVKNVIDTVVPAVKQIGATLLIAFTTVQIITFSRTLYGLVTAFGTIRSAIDLATAAQLTFQSIQLKIGLVIPIVAAIAATYLAATYAAEKFKEAQVAAFEASSKPIQLKFSTTVSELKTNSSKRVLDFENSTRKMTADYNRFIAQANQANDKFAANAKKAFDKTTDALENSFSISLNYIRKIVNSIENEENKISKNLEKLSEGNAEIVQEAQQKSYEGRLEDYSKFAEKQKEIASKIAEQTNDPTGGFDYQNIANGFQKIADDYRKLLRGQIKIAFDTHDLDTAQSLFKQLIGTYDTFKSNLSALDIKVNVDPQIKAETQNMLDMRNQYAASQKDNLKDIELQSVEARKKLKDLEDIYKNIAEFREQVFDKKTGNLTEDYKNKPSQALVDLQTQQAKAIEIANQIGKMGGDENAQARSKSILEDIKEQFEAQKKALALSLTAATNSETLIKASETRKSIAAEEVKIYSDLEAKQVAIGTKLAENIKNLQLYLSTLQNVTNSFGQTDNKLTVMTSGQAGWSNTNKLNEIFDRMKALSQDPTKNANELQSLFQQVQQPIEYMKRNQVLDAANPSGDYTTVGDSLQKLGDSINGIATNKSVLKDLTTDMATLKESVTNIDSKSLDALNTVMGNIGNQAASVNAGANATDALATATKNLADAIEAEAAAQAQLNQIRAQAVVPAAAPSGEGGSVEGHASGGVAGSQGGFLAAFMSGAFAKGTDTIPAMLTRGEFVVRAPMARKFFSQLVAMNNNQAPIYRSEGGSTSSTTNSNTYHIHVSGGEGGSSNDLAKKVVQSIRRAQAQGVIRS